MPLEFRSIERVEAPSVKSFRERFEGPRRPVIMTGAMHRWRALSLWTPDYLVARHGSTRVDVRVSDVHAPQSYTGDPRGGFERRQMDLASSVEQALSGEPRVRQYLQYCDIDAVLPELSSDIERPAYCPRWFVSPAFLWLAGTGTKNPLHYDLNHVLMAQVVGRKRYVLFAPEDSRFISTPLARRLWRTSALDPEEPDYASWPELSRSKPYACTLLPGEMLFIPYRYWHYASMEEFNVSVSRWWEPNATTKLRDLLVHRALAPVKLAVRALGRA